jgi:hypothetical protein
MQRFFRDPAVQGRDTNKNLGYHTVALPQVVLSIYSLRLGSQGSNRFASGQRRFLIGR